MERMKKSLPVMVIILAFLMTASSPGRCGGSTPEPISEQAQSPPLPTDQGVLTSPADQGQTPLIEESQPTSTTEESETSLIEEESEEEQGMSIEFGEDDGSGDEGWEDDSDEDEDEDEDEEDSDEDEDEGDDEGDWGEE